MNPISDGKPIFYTVIDGQQKGPFTHDEILQMRESGIVTSETLSWKDGTENWTPLKNLLADASAGPPYPSVSVPSAAPAVPPPMAYRSDALGFAILGCCCIYALFQWSVVLIGYQGSWQDMLGWAIFLTVAILIYIDAKSLGMGADGDRTPKGRRRTGPVVWMIIAGGIFTPFYLYRRRLYGARNLCAPAVFAVISALAGVALAAVGVFSELMDGPPNVDSPEVISLVKDIIKRDAGVSSVEVSSPVEVSYDPNRQRRVGRAFVKAPTGDLIPFVYSVQWHSTERKEFFVKVASQESELQ